MRVGYFIPDVKEYGEFKRCFSIAKNMVGLGHQVTVISGSTKTTFRITTEMRDGVRLIKLPYFHPFSSDNRVESGKVKVQPQEYVGQIIQGMISFLFSLLYDFDVVHCFSFSLPLSTTAAFSSKILKKRKLILDWVDVRGRDGIGSSYNYFVHSLLTIFEERMITLADALTVTSSFLAKRASILGAKNIFHIPTGSNIDVVKPLSKDYARKQLGYKIDSKLLVYEGGTRTTEELVISLLRAFRRASENDPELKMIILGCEVTSSIRLFAEESCLNKTLSFVSRQPQLRIGLYLGAADLLVLPLLDNDVYKAGWPGRFGDLICASRPILVSDVGDVPQLIVKEKIGLIAGPDDPEDFARKIEYFFNNMDEMNCGIEEKTMKLACKYSWSRIAAKVSLIYQDKLPSGWDGERLDLF